jgi:hypothetical protein
MKLVAEVTEFIAAHPQYACTHPVKAAETVVDSASLV